MISTLYAIESLRNALLTFDGARKFWLALSSFAMLAPVAVVMLAVDGAAEAPARAHAVVSGMERIVLVLAAALIARALYALGAAVAQARQRARDDAMADAGYALNA